MKQLSSLAYGMIALVTLSTLLTLQISAQRPKPVRFSFQGDFGPSLVPTTGTDLCTATDQAACKTNRSVYVTSIMLSEESGAGDTCYIVDRQATPRGILGTAAHPQTINGTFVISLPYRLAINGLTWGCTNGTVTGYVTYEY